MDRILYNAKIYTQDPQNPVAQALAIKDGRVVAIGSNESILNLPASQFSKENMAGSAIFPGLTDAHIHLHLTARNLTFIDCDTDTKAECLARIKERIAVTPPGVWILGHGWNQNNWSDGYGNRRDLDELSDVHPIFLTAKSLHAAWANSLALQIAGITEESSDPPGGRFARSSEGKLTGILFESAYPIIEESIPDETVDQVAQSIQKAQSMLWRFGITSVHDFDGARLLQALQYLEREALLKLRVLKTIPYPYLNEAITVGLMSGFGSDRIKLGSLKLFADGALGPQTAAMLTPYLESNQNPGVLLLTKDEILEIGKKTSRAGISLAIHAIGDRANQEVLEALIELRSFEKQQYLYSLRHRIEHAQLLNAELLPRFIEANITASVQPIHLISDRKMADRYWGTRCEYAYAFGDLVNQGTQTVFGSDSPVESPNPFVGMYAATTRLDMESMHTYESWYPRQIIALEEAIRSYTTRPAILAGWTHNKGRLHYGEDADLIVMKDDLYSLPLLELKNQLPVATMFAGEWVWQE